MRLHRTKRRSTLLLLLSWGLVATALAHGAGGAQPKIVFPVVAPVKYANDFGDARPGGRHEGVDIVTARGAPVVAAEAGKVVFETGSARAGCMLYLHGRSGASYLYIHLNNDLTKRNDNRGRCVGGVAYARGLRSGQSVQAGDLIGYAGDSGDANGAHPHLHFELHPGGGGAVSPYSALRRAQKLLFTTPRGARAPLTLRLEGSIEPATLVAARPLLRLRVRTARLPDGSRFTVSRTVALALPPAVVIERLTPFGLVPGGLADLTSGGAAAVESTSFKPSLDAKLATPGVLAAREIVVRRSR